MDFRFAPFALSTLLLCAGCSKESVTATVTLPYAGLVDERLIPYFLEFERQGAFRGVETRLADLQVRGYIKSIQEDDIAGTCTYRASQPNVVTIDLEYWNAVPALRREMVVFHELGHCVLGRDHLETAFSNGVCTTIMNSGTSGCFVAYTTENRAYYLDELFGQ